MKKFRLIPMMFLLVGVLVVSCFAVGCNGVTLFHPNGHVHTFSEEWTIDEETHYHAATCEHTNLVKDKTYHNLVYGAHEATDTTCAFVGYACVCGYAVLDDGTPAQQHALVNHPQQGDGCITPIVSAYKTCSLCDYSTPRTVTPAKGAHTFETGWSADDNYHYHASECGHIEEVSARALHTYINGECLECGHAEPTVFLAYGFTNNGAAYEVIGIGDVTGTEINVPSIYNGKPVVGVGKGAFKNNTNITKVVLAQDVQSIGQDAFYGCTSLTEVVLYRGFNTIGQAAFAGCTNLTSIHLPSTLKGIGTYAFDGCVKLENVTIPASLSSIGEQAFAHCESITSIWLPASLSVLYPNTFLGCKKLASVDLPAALTAIRMQVFYGCEALTSITLPQSLTYIGLSAFEKSGLTSITMPDTVTTLASYVFRDCKALKTAVLSKSLTVATDTWFSGCGALTSLSLPFTGAHVDQLTDGNVEAFGYIFGKTPYEGGVAVKYKEGTPSETTYYVPQGLASVTIYGGSADHWDNGTNTGAYTYQIKANTFENCSMIKTVRIGEKVKNIGANAFKGCNITAAVFDVTTGWTAEGNDVMLGSNAAQNAVELMSGQYSGKAWRRS